MLQLRSRPKVRFLVNELIDVDIECQEGLGEVSTRRMRIFGTQFYWPMELETAVIQQALQLSPGCEETSCHLDILVTHGPCKGFVDESQGCEQMLDMVIEHIHPHLVVSGHIHDVHGIVQACGITFINAAISGPKAESRRKGWDPIVVQLP